MRIMLQEEAGWGGSLPSAHLRSHAPTEVWEGSSTVRYNTTVHISPTPGRATGTDGGETTQWCIKVSEPGLTVIHSSCNAFLSNKQADVRHLEPSIQCKARTPHCLARHWQLLLSLTSHTKCRSRSSSAVTWEQPASSVWQRMWHKNPLKPAPRHFWLRSNSLKYKKKQNTKLKVLF